MIVGKGVGGRGKYMGRVVKFANSPWFDIVWKGNCLDIGGFARDILQGDFLMVLKFTKCAHEV